MPLQIPFDDPDEDLSLKNRTTTGDLLPIPQSEDIPLSSATPDPLSSPDLYLEHSDTTLFLSNTRNTDDLTPYSPEEVTMVPTPHTLDQASLHSLDETSLVLRAINGDEESFNILYHIYHYRICSHIQAQVGNRQCAEDLTQDTFIKAYRKLSTLTEPASFKPWLYRIASNISYDYLRKKKKRRWFFWSKSNESQSSNNYYGDTQYSQESTTVDDEMGIRTLLMKEAFHTVMQRIPAIRRACFHLCTLGYSISETACLLNLSEKTVRTYISTTRREIRAEFHNLLADQR